MADKLVRLTSTRRTMTRARRPPTGAADAEALTRAAHPLRATAAHRTRRRARRQQRKGAHSQTNARMPYEVFGYRMWDKVQLEDGTIGFVGARRKTGIFKVKDIFGNVIGNKTYKKLRLVRRATTLPSQMMILKATP